MGPALCRKPPQNKKTLHRREDSYKAWGPFTKHGIPSQNVEALNRRGDPPQRQGQETFPSPMKEPGLLSEPGPVQIVIHIT